MSLYNCEKCSPAGSGVSPFESPDGTCPKCKRSRKTLEPGEPSIRKLSTIHLLVRDDNGPIKIINSDVGRTLRYGFLCSPDGLPPKPDPGDDNPLFTGSADGRPPVKGAVTCLACNVAMLKDDKLKGAVADAV